MGRPASVNVDRRGFLECILDYCKRHNTNKTAFAKSLGFASTYFTETLRENKPKGITQVNYKYICSVLNIPEDKYLIKDEPKPQPKKAEEKPLPVVVNSGITPEQFNALLQAINTLTTTIGGALEKIASAQNSGAIISGKIYGEVQELAKVFGVEESTSKPAEKHSSVTVKPQYSSKFGEKK